jgi:hypothetical protein
MSDMVITKGVAIMNPTECGEMMISNVIAGACVGDTNPDAWFPEYTVGRPTPEKMKVLVDDIHYAINICGKCTESEACLIEGMKDENLPYGIWGGLLAGDRIELLGKPREEYVPYSDERLALEFLDRIKPKLGR